MAPNHSRVRIAILTCFVVLAFSVPVKSGLAQIVIDADTFWPESTYEVESLTIRNGAALTVAGGSRLDVAGDLSVIESSTVLLEAKNTAAMVDGEWRGAGVAVEAENLTIENGSTISADGQGYVGGAGPGAGGSYVGCSGSTAGGGAGHGGLGGTARLETDGGSSYGSGTDPIELGSGGGNNPPCEVSTSNAGGGLVDLVVRGVLQLDGTITADAARNLAARLGGGSGGSIRVTADVLTGAGSFSADGADAGNEFAAGGAGGRIAVYYENALAFPGFAASTANGGTGFGVGEIGTVAFFDTSDDPPELFVYANMVFAQDSEIDYEAITLDNLATMRVGGGSTIDVTGELTLRGRSTLLLEGKNVSERVAGSWMGEGVTINAGNVDIEDGSTISADGQGYLGPAGPGAGESFTGCAASTAGAGGGHGGTGGSAEFGNDGGGSYGSSIAPTDLGSGGGNNPPCETSTANAGGGAIVMNVSGFLQLNGTITASGAADLIPRLGGGAGGSILLTTDRLTGSGLFSANGAGGGNIFSGGGAGGRIAVYYDEALAFTGFVSSTAEGGSGFENGDPGTVAFFDTSVESSHLHVLQNLVFDPDSDITYGAITLDNGATMRVGGGSVMTVARDLTVSGNSTLLLQAKNTTMRVVGEWLGEGVTINADNVTVDAGSRISADAQGYIGTVGPGAGGSEAGCNASTAGAGAGHGGRGGDARFGAAGGSAYGSLVAPLDPGSGGGNNPGCNVDSTVNAGGGAVRLDVQDVLDLSGAITADAAGALPGRLGGGAGGAVYVTTDDLIGTGFVSAVGAAGGNDSAGGGSGGRIAVYSARGAGFGGSHPSSVAGGTGFADGERGSLLFIDTQCDGDCDENGSVAIDELVEAVGIAIASSAAERCLAADSDGNGIVSVDELIRAIARALHGC